MNELVFHVEQDGSWLVATCHEPEMATQAGRLEELVPMIRDLVLCRFEQNELQRSWPIRLHPCVPMHREIRPKTLQSILKQAGITLEDLLAHL